MVYVVLFDIIGEFGVYLFINNLRFIFGIRKQIPKAPRVSQFHQETIEYGYSGY